VTHSVEALVIGMVRDNIEQALRILGSGVYPGPREFDARELLTAALDEHFFLNKAKALKAKVKVQRRAQFQAELEIVLKCAACGLTSEQEPSVALRADSFARCDACERKVHPL
jgi:uncharacterized protein with PIN domain